MSRPKRELRKRFDVYCEGDTEYNYFNGMRTKQGVELVLNIINMEGGGYSNFLNVIKSKGQSNCIAKFIIIDGDRIKKDAGENENFRQLLEYCARENKKGGIAYFLIVNNPDFEYISCLHVDGYKGQKPEQFITKVLGFSNIKDFKKKRDVYDYLNNGDKNYQIMVDRLKVANKMVKNDYIIDRKTFEVKIIEVIFSLDKAGLKGSNIDEFFEVIDW